MMRTLKNFTIGVTVLALFGLAGASLPTGRASAQRGQQPTQVEIVAPLPVPIGGSVGITGTPTVTVGNNASNPVSIRSVDNPVRQAVTFFASIEVPDGSYGGSEPNAFTVPTGKRLVLQYVSGHASLQPGQKPLVSMFTAYGSGGYRHYLPSVPAGDFSATSARPEEFTINQALRLYSDPPFSILVNFERNSNQGLAILQLTFSGYLADM